MPLASAVSEPEKREFRALIVRHEVRLPVTPMEVFDAPTGNISGWWDHHFSENPKALFIEPKAGGQFLEIMDDAGAAVEHARVTQALPGKKLILTGPLGFAGGAFSLVTTITLEADGWDQAIEGVWAHFMTGRLLPYVTAGCHKSSDRDAFQ